MHPSKNRVNYHHNVSQTFMLTGNHLSLSLGGTVLKIVPLTQVNFFSFISQYMTVQVMWKAPALVNMKGGF